MLDGQYLTVTEAARELELSRQRVHSLIKSGQLAAETVHERLLVIPSEALAAFKKLDRPAGLHISQRPTNPRRKRGKRPA